MQNCIFMKKINIFWGINLILFVAVVFLGIEQASRGAEISSLEGKLETISVQKRNLTEDIFRSGSDNKLTDNATELGFAKPSKVYYFNSIDAVASLK